MGDALTAAGRGLRVLLVEDSFVASEMIAATVEGIGHQVVGRAAAGLQAVELTLSLRPDVVLMDIDLGDGIDGLEATRRIQQAWPTPVVVLTAFQTPEMVARAGEVGVGGYLTKPPSAAEVDRAITVAMARFADMVELRRLNRALEAEMAERSRAQEARLRAEKMAALGRLVAGVAHHINNPLQAARGFVEVAQRELVDGRARLDVLAESLSVIERETGRIADMVRRLRAVAVAQSEGPGGPVATDVRAVLAAVLDGTLGELTRAGLEEQRDWATDAPAVAADAQHLRLIFEDLVANAAGGVRVAGTRLVTRVAREDRPGSGGDLRPGVVVEFVDDGKGMPEEALPHAFEPFFSLDARRPGLGLFVVGGLVHLHDGEVRLTSAPGRGTTVTVWLPAAPSELG